MGDEVTADPQARRVSGPGWSLHADRLEVLDDGGWRAVIGVRRDLVLAVESDGTTDPGDELSVDAWAGEPGQSEGVAVITAGDGAAELALVPMCSCGEYGCSNSGIQLSKQLAGADLASLVEYLRGLPWSSLAPTAARVLRGDGLAATEDPNRRPEGRWWVSRRRAVSPGPGRGRAPRRR